ncbi:unnamed protein product [Brassica rapa subsp. trilocularis]
MSSSTSPNSILKPVPLMGSSRTLDLITKLQWNQKLYNNRG